MKAGVEAKLEESVTVFGVEFGKNTKRLVGGLWSMGPLFVAARFFSALGQIVAGRLLGPEQYGLATLAVAAATLLTIPLNLGFASGMMKYGSMEERAEGQTAYISTALWANVLAAVPCCFLLYVFRGPVSGLLRIDTPLYLWSLLYAVAWSAYTIVSTIPQALTRFGQRGWTESIYGGAALALFLALYFSFHRDFTAFLLSLIGAIVLAGAFAAWASRDRIRFVFSRRALLEMSSYYLPPVIGACAVSLIMTATPLILAHYLSPSSVGILSIYELGTVGIAAVLSQILGTVLTPLTTVSSRQAGAWSKFFLLSVPVCAASFVIFMASDYVALKLVGRGYPINAGWMALFSLAAALSIPSGAASSLLSSRDASSLWLGTAGSILSGLASVAAILWAVPRYGFVGAGVAAVAAYGVGLVAYVGCGAVMTSR